MPTIAQTSFQNPPTQPPECGVNAGIAPHSSVLLVARDESLGEPCRIVLANAGVQRVVSVRNCKRALELLDASDPFDAVVICVGLGDVGAVGLAEFMCRYHTSVPTVIVSPVAYLRIPGALWLDVPPAGSAVTDKTEVLRGLIRGVLSNKLRQGARLTL